jgi:glycosyltransferase involved in cell wall biosynthesis
MASRDNQVVSIFWGPHSRQTEDMARQLGSHLYAIHYLFWRKFSFLAPIKYVLQALKTWEILVRRRPCAVYVVIPPTFSALAVFVYCRLARVPYIMDVHGHTLTSRKWKWTIPLQRFLARRALATVVDQPSYQRAFRQWGARTIILERAPVQVTHGAVTRNTSASGSSVTVVSIFAEDEPIDLVLAAARELPDVCFYITGDTGRASKQLLGSAPKNVTFTGYLKGDDFWQRLAASSAVMTLTTEPYSLVSGGIEAIALGRPAILSRQPVLEEYFTRGTVFVDYTVPSLVAGIREAMEEEAQLALESAALADEKRRRWESARDELLGLIDKNTVNTRQRVPTS